MEDNRPDTEYEIGQIVSASDVPNWARREPKWQKLVKAVLALPPGESLPVRFPDVDSARRARNTVRDSVNLRIREAAVVRTRLVQEEEQVVVYFTRLRDEDVVEEAREDPE